MAKTKTAYVCTDCGADFNKWQGQCAECKAWNTLKELRLGSASSSAKKSFQGYSGGLSQVQALSEVDLKEQVRLSTGAGEFDRVLGGGLVPGSVVLIGGNPGAGKSTLLLQTLCHLSQHMDALYITGEESLQQVAMRAQRLQLPMDKLKVVAETSVEAICNLAEQLKPKLIVVDSIQVVSVEDVPSAPGGVSQVRESAAMLTRFAKQNNTALFLVGHVTKEGSLAGPKVLEHMVDCSILIEGSSDTRFRTLRSSKNRFGAVNELGVFAMTETGLKEVKNPSAIFLSRQEPPAPGSIVMVVWEGSRPLLVEVQALVDESYLENPRRVVVGLDHNRLAMLLAVLHRHGGLQLGDQDVFVNVVAGVKINETAADLAATLAMVSSFRNFALPADLMVFGEIGLSGEIRPVPSGPERLREAVKHGFKRAIVAKANAPKTPIKGLQVHGVQSLAEALELI